MSARFYVGLEEAPRLLAARRQYRSAVEKWWQERGFAFPDAFRGEQGIGFVSRHIATARYEDCAFIRLCERVGLVPVWSTYVRDGFIDRSAVKCSYIRPRIVTRFGNRKGAPIVEITDHAHPKRVEGVPLDEIITAGGDRLVDWHRRLLEMAYPGAKVTDPSEIYRQCGGAKGYYPLLLSLGIAHGVFFEDFHGGESGSGLTGFTGTVFEPAFEEVAKRFGVSPLIVPLPWWQELGYYVSPALAGQWRSHRVILKDLLA